MCIIFIQSLSVCALGIDKNASFVFHYCHAWRASMPRHPPHTPTHYTHCDFIMHASVPMRARHNRVNANECGCSYDCVRAFVWVIFTAQTLRHNAFHAYFSGIHACITHSLCLRLCYVSVWCLCCIKSSSTPSDHCGDRTQPSLIIY